MADPRPALKIAKPEFFDGTPGKFRDWIRQLAIYVRGNGITKDDDRILLALSYMKGGTASSWAAQYIDNNLAKPNLGPWQTFYKELELAFEDRTATKRVREEIESFTQGRQKIDEFFNKFEMMAQDAGLATSEVEKIRLIERNVNPAIINAIYSSGTLPTSYADYKGRILRIGRLWEQRREQISYSQKPTPQTHPHIPIQRPQAPLTTECKTPTGVVFGGQGKPMDIDGLKRDNKCFNCREQGHFRRNCPKPAQRKINVRAIAMELTDEERLELAEALAKDEVSRDEEPTDKFVEDFLEGQ
jgi:hypothetical protein